MAQVGILSRYTESEQERREREAREDVMQFFASISPSERLRLIQFFSGPDRDEEKAKAASA